MLILVFLTVFQVSFSVGNDLLSKFHQNDYETKDWRSELVRYDKNVFRIFEIKTFKFNRTTVAFNITMNLNIDFYDRLEVVIQAYKFASNEFREFPARFQENVSKMYAANTIGFKSVSKCGNVESFYFLKDITYHACNFVVDDSYLPPLIPTGIYKLTWYYTLLEKEVLVINYYYEVYRPIYLPKKRN